MNERQFDVTIIVHETEILFVVRGIPEGPDYSVGIGYGLEDPVLLWPDEMFVEEAVLKIRR